MYGACGYRLDGDRRGHTFIQSAYKSGNKKKQYTIITTINSLPNPNAGTYFISPSVVWDRLLLIPLALLDVVAGKPDHHCRLSEGQNESDWIPYLAEKNEYSECEIYVELNDNKTASCTEWEYTNIDDIGNTVVSQVVLETRSLFLW